jgi:hypothetical protein
MAYSNFLSREAATANDVQNCFRRFAAWKDFVDSWLRADAHGYLLPPLRG